MILNDMQIVALNAVKPFIAHKVRGDGVMSYGLDSYGYGLRLADEFMVPNRTLSGVLDPKAMVEEFFVRTTGDWLVIEPRQCVLGRTLEYITMPDDVLGIVHGKSTYARLGITIIVTPIEPGWQGQITLEIANVGSRPVKVYAGEGIGQIVFFRGEPPRNAYDGYYQGQVGVTTARNYEENT